MDFKENTLGTEPVGRLMLKFAVPAASALLVNSLYNIVDQIFIGNSGAQTLGNGATAVAFPIVSITMAAALLFGNGGAAFASLKMGENKTEEAGKALVNAFAASLVLSLVLTAAGLIFLEPIMLFFGSTPEVLPYAKTYSGILLIGVPFMTLGSGMSNFIRADGSPVIAMGSLLAGAVLNILLDLLFINVFRMGVAGAAIATVISQAASAVIVFVYFLKYGKHMKLDIKKISVNIKILGKIVTLGLSSCVTQLAITVVQITMNNALKKYAGVGNMSVDASVALASMGIITKVNGIMISIVSGIAFGAQPILGYNKGAKKYGRIKKTYLISVLYATCASALCWAVSVFLSQPVISLFGKDDPEFLSFAPIAMRTYLMCIFTAGYVIVSCNYFQATGQPVKATLLTLTRQIFLLVPLILLLPRFFGIKGILYAGPASDLLSALVITVFTAKEIRKLNRASLDEAKT